MDKWKKVGKNIQDLRKAHGETGPRLGDAIGVSKSAISNYENGTRRPDKDILLAIAARYSVTVEQLYNGDFSNLPKIKINSAFMGEHLSEIIPVVSSLEAMTNDHFKTAYNIHSRYLRYWDNPDKVVISENDIDTCLDEYVKAFESDQSRYVALANYLGLLVRLLFPIKMIPAIADAKSAAMEIAKNQNPSFKQEIEDPNSSFREDAQAIINEMGDYDIDEAILEPLRLLKQSKEWSDLADYYLALRYIYNLVDSGQGYDYNLMIGAEMLSSFASVGNKYAKQYIGLSLKSVGA